MAPLAERRGIATRAREAAGTALAAQAPRDLPPHFQPARVAFGPVVLVPPRTHVARLFVRPETLAACLARHGVWVVETRGLDPARGAPRFPLGYLVRRESGGFRVGDDRSISYIGYGVKEADAPIE